MTRERGLNTMIAVPSGDERPRVSEPLSDLLARHVAAGTVPGAVGVLGDGHPVSVGLDALRAPPCARTRSSGSSP